MLVFTFAANARDATKSIDWADVAVLKGTGRRLWSCSVRQGRAFEKVKFAIEDLLAKLPLPATEKWKDGVWDLEPFEKAGVKLVFFAPRGTDYQTTHDDDEFYFIVRGSGEIVINGERSLAAAGDAFFVEAGVPHRFEKFTDDFATWAVFF
mgnify:CR=1 FL=1